MTEAQPPTPTNVSVVFRNGTTLAVDCLYIGLDGEGIHTWEVIIAPVALSRIKTITADELPARTQVRLPII